MATTQAQQTLVLIQIYCFLYCNDFVFKVSIFCRKDCSTVESPGFGNVLGAQGDEVQTFQARIRWKVARVGGMEHGLCDHFAERPRIAAPTQR